MGQLVYFNGKTVLAEEASVSPYDHGFLYGDGVFEGIRVYSGRVFKLKEHIERLFASARALMIVMPGSVDDMVRSVLDLVKQNEVDDGYVRITVSRGVGLGLDPRACKSATVVVMTDKLSLYPTEMYTNGLEVVTVSTRIPPAQSIEPRVKSLGKYVCNIQAKIEANRVGAGEGLMLNVEGYVAEATGDNIFLIKNGEIITPPACAGILEGITRNTVMELAGTRGYTVRESLFTLFDVYTADECFLTGTAAEVIPVVRVDGRTIGKGIPGPVTLDLMTAFREVYEERGNARVSDQIRLCRVCGAREVTASVAIWEGGHEQSQTFLCTVCAEREEKLCGYDGASLSLARVASFIAERQARRAGADPNVGCPMCGATLADTVAEGLLGCGYCYLRFKTEVAASIRLAQGSVQHHGKSPVDG